MRQPNEFTDSQELILKVDGQEYLVDVWHESENVYEPRTNLYPGSNYWSVVDFGINSIELNEWDPTLMLPIDTKEKIEKHLENAIDEELAEHAY